MNGVTVFENVLTVYSVSVSGGPYLICEKGIELVGLVDGLAFLIMVGFFMPGERWSFTYTFECSLDIVEN